MGYPPAAASSVDRRSGGRSRRLIALMVALLCACVAVRAAATGTMSCGVATGTYICQYACDTGSDDVDNINAAIVAVSGNGGGVVSLAAGVCLTNQPIVFVNTAHVWLKGAGAQPGGTTLQRTVFAFDTNMIAANQTPPGTVPYSNQDVTISDMTVDPGPLFATTRKIQPEAEGAKRVVFPARAFSGQSAWCPPPLDGVAQECLPGRTSGAGLFDFSHFSFAAGRHHGNETTPHPPLQLRANGNVTSIKADASGRLLIHLSNPVTRRQWIADGDSLVLFSGGGNVDVEYVDGVDINNLNLLDGGAIVIQLDKNFTVSNSTLASPDDVGTFYCLGGLFIGNNAGNAPLSNGVVTNNTLSFTSMEVDSTQSFVSGNMVQGTACGGINGSGGQYDVFQGNTIHDSAYDITVDGIDVPANHDFLVNQAMQVWNPDALIVGNLVFGNGGAGILSGGSNNVLSHNTIYNNGLSAFVKSARQGSGITIQASPLDANAVTNTTLTGNIVCNAPSPGPSGAPACAGRGNTGPQRYALDVEPNVVDTNVGTDNHLYPGYAGLIYNDGQRQIGMVDDLPRGAVAARPCVLRGALCSTSLTWSAAGMANASIAARSADSQTWQTVGTGLRGAQQISWIGNAIYVFELISDDGLPIASTTLQPSNYSR